MLQQSNCRITKTNLNPTFEEKIEAMFLGIGIGDALGLAVETKSSSEILQQHPYFKDYLDPSLNELWPKSPLGTWSDDTQLTLAMARALIKKGLDLDEIAREHVIAYEECILGWGKSTLQTIQAIKNGRDPRNFDAEKNSHRGVGNGVVMKLAPLAAYLHLNNDSYLSNHEFIKQLTFMTHPTILAFSASMAHLAALTYCLKSSPETFKHEDFIDQIVFASEYAIKDGPALPSSMYLPERLKLLREWSTYDTAKIITELKGGSYVYESLPFSLMFFIKDPFSSNSMFESIWAGGDTDSNGSIVASLLGALHGKNIFPENLVLGLHKSELISQIAFDLLHSSNSGTANNFASFS